MPAFGKLNSNMDKHYNIIALKNVTTTYDSTGTLLSCNTPRYMTLLSDVSGVYFFQLNRNINFELAVFGLCHCCIQ